MHAQVSLFDFWREARPMGVVADRLQLDSLAVLIPHPIMQLTTPGLLAWNKCRVAPVSKSICFRFEKAVWK